MKPTTTPVPKSPIFLACILFFVFTFIGCEKQIDLDLKSTGGKPVVFAFIQPDSALQISLSKSVTTLSTANYEPMTDARIWIYKNSQLYKTIVFTGEQLWETYQQISFSSNDSLSLKIIQDNNEITATKTHIPQKIDITPSDTTTEFKIGKDGIWKYHINLNLSITDPAETSDFYQLMIIETIFKQTDIGFESYQDTIDVPKTDSQIYNSNQGSLVFSDIDFQGLFTDKYINGKQHNIKLSFPADEFRKPSDATSKKLDIRLYHLSEDYYNYFKAQILSSSFEGLPIFEPIEIPGNIPNGYGLVTGLTVSQIIMDIQ